MAPPNGTPSSNMSSRLMNMKFMQRAAASQGSSPSTPAEPAAKKQRLSNGSVRSTPASTPRSEVENGLDADEVKREEAFAREAAARGDSKWYLSIQEPQNVTALSPLRVVSAGYGALDSVPPAGNHSSESDEEEPTKQQVPGRRSFGKFNKGIQKQQNGDGPSDSDSSSEGSEASEDEDESDDPTGVNALIAAQRREAGDRARAERKAKKVADRADAARMAEGHRKKDINLNNVTTISGFGGGGGRTPPGLKDRECYKCGGKGHLKHQCPQADRSKRKRDLT